MSELEDKLSRELTPGPWYGACLTHLTYGTGLLGTWGDPALAC